jgi:hypothetical protein
MFRLFTNAYFQGHNLQKFINVEPLAPAMIIDNTYVENVTTHGLYSGSGSGSGGKDIPVVDTATVSGSNSYIKEFNEANIMNSRAGQVYGQRRSYTELPSIQPTSSRMNLHTSYGNPINLAVPIDSHILRDSQIKSPINGNNQMIPSMNDHDISRALTADPMTSESVNLSNVSNSQRNSYNIEDDDDDDDVKQ